jgi:hypothetical protein
MEWDGFTPTIFPVGQPAPAGLSLVCKIYKVPPICTATCGARIYYVFGTTNMTHACVHLGLHEHLVKASKNQEIKKRMRTLIGEEVERTPKATDLAIVMEATKERMNELLIDPKGALVRKLDLEELVIILNKCKYMSSSSIKNEVTAFRYIQRCGVMDSITMLKGCSHWAYIQEIKFPGQGSDSDKVFVFKKSEVGPGTGVHLVKQMQPTSDLEDA